MSDTSSSDSEAVPVEPCEYRRNWRIHAFSVVRYGTIHTFRECFWCTITIFADGDFFFILLVLFCSLAMIFVLQ